MFLLALLIIISTAAFVFHLKLKRIHKKFEKIPGPPILPFVGNAFDFGTNNVDVLINLKRIAKQYGSVVRLCIGPQVYLLLSEPRYIAQVLFSTAESVNRPEFYQLLNSVVGGGLITASGEKWYKHRRILSHSFLNKHLISYMSTFNNNSNIVVTQLKKIVHFGPIDATDSIFDFTLNTICNTVLNVDANADREYREAAVHALDISLNRFFSIFKRLDFFYKFTSEYKLVESYKKKIKDYTEDIIRKRKKYIAGKNKDAKSPFVLDHMLQLSEEEAFTDEEILDEVKTLVFAGSDTVGATLSFGVFELARHPEVQKKILEETNQILGTNKDADVTYEDVHHMTYIDCVFKELLRVYSPASFLMRKLHQDMKFDEVTIPAGTNIMVFIAGSHLSESNFPNAERFDPDRHLPENNANVHPCAFIPFGAGSRICLGQKFGTLEAKVMLAKLVRNFEILPVEPKHEIILAMAGTLKCANGLPVKLIIRETI